MTNSKEDIEYPKCSNGACNHNNKYCCTTKGQNEDIICKQGKADAMKKIKCSKSVNKKLKS